MGKITCNIVYVCPKCGGNLQYETEFTDPPKHITKCTKCDWKYIEPDEVKDVIKLPFPDHHTYLAPADSAFNNDACAGCPNNIKNGGSGICHCILGNRISY